MFLGYRVYFSAALATRCGCVILFCSGGVNRVNVCHFLVVPFQEMNVLCPIFSLQELIQGWKLYFEDDKDSSRLRLHNSILLCDVHF